MLTIDMYLLGCAPSTLGLNGGGEHDCGRTIGSTKKISDDVTLAVGA